VDSSATPSPNEIRLCHVPNPVRRNRKVGHPWFIVEAFIMVRGPEKNARFVFGVRSSVFPPSLPRRMQKNVPVSSHRSAYRPLASRGGPGETLWIS
jgi:hypothetical protein